MKVTVLAVGRARGPAAGAIAEYEARAGRYWKLEVVEVDSASGGDDPASVRAGEADRILSRLPDGAALVALTREAKGMSSRGLARWLQRRAVHAAGDVCFVVGGAYGLDEAVLRRADRRLSLSPMTLPHDVARLVLLEQLYRAGTITRGEPYHKGG